MKATALCFKPWAYSRVELPVLAFKDCFALLPRVWKKSLDKDSEASFQFFISARYGLYWVLKSIDLRPEDRVLLPIYHSGSEIRAWLQFTDHVQFYDLHQDLSPDLEDIARKIGPGTRAIHVIHYFGFVNDLSGLKELAAKNNLLLIEDACHTHWCGNSPVGHYGDVVLFSCRKIIPTPDGGLVRLNNGAHLPAPLPLRHAGQRRLVELSQIATILNLLKNYSILRLGSSGFVLKIVFALAFAALHGSSRLWELLFGKAVNLEHEEFYQAQCNLPMGSFAKASLNYYDFKEIENIRRNHYFYLLRKIAEHRLPVLPLRPTLQSFESPLVLPFFVQAGKGHISSSDARNTFTWIHGFWNGALLQEKKIEFSACCRPLYENLFHIPVHQSMTQVHLDLALEELQSLCSGVAGR